MEKNYFTKLSKNSKEALVKLINLTCHEALTIDDVDDIIDFVDRYDITDNELKNGRKCWWEMDNRRYGTAIYIDTLEEVEEEELAKELGLQFKPTDRQELRIMAESIVRGNMSYYKIDCDYLYDIDELVKDFIYTDLSIEDFASKVDEICYYESKMRGEE